MKHPSIGAVPRRVLALALGLSLAGCAELSTVVDVVFPSAVPGLPADQPWESLPIRRWLTDSPLDPVAISICPACPEPAVAGLFSARGEAAEPLRRAAGDPAAMLASILRADHSERSRRKAQGRGKDDRRARVTAEPAAEGGAPGFVVRLSRGNGSRRAAGYVAVLDRGDAARVLVIVAGSEASARSLAREVVPRL